MDEIGAQRAKWVWSLSLIALTIALHALVLVMMALMTARIRAPLESRHFDMRYAIPIVLRLVETVAPETGTSARPCPSGRPLGSGVEPQPDGSSDRLL